MISLAIIPDSTTVTINIPAEYVRQKVRIDIQPLPNDDQENASLPEPDPMALEEVRKFYASLSKDLSGLYFDRNEAYER